MSVPGVLPPCGCLRTASSDWTAKQRIAAWRSNRAFRLSAARTHTPAAPCAVGGVAPTVGDGAKPARGARRLRRRSRKTEQWWSVSGSNRRPPACKAGALPAELTPLAVVLPACGGRTLRAAPCAVGVSLHPSGTGPTGQGPARSVRRRSRRPGIMVGRDGLEPSTSRLSGVCSNHLSYRPAGRPGQRPDAAFPWKDARRGAGRREAARRRHRWCSPASRSVPKLKRYEDGPADMLRRAAKSIHDFRALPLRCMSAG